MTSAIGVTPCSPIIFTDVSEEGTAFIFRVGEQVMQATSKTQTTRRALFTATVESTPDLKTKYQPVDAKQVTGNYRNVMHVKHP
jgi:hypothetical protein